MFTVRYEDLHREHHNLMSKIEYWKHKILFLDSICEKLKDKGADSEELTPCINKLQHLKRHLNNLEVQIHSHESFLKSYAVDDGLALMLDEQDHSMEHMREFELSFQELNSTLVKMNKENN